MFLNQIESLGLTNMKVILTACGRTYNGVPWTKALLDIKGVKHKHKHKHKKVIDLQLALMGRVKWLLRVTILLKQKILWKYISHWTIDLDQW